MKRDKRDKAISYSLRLLGLSPRSEKELRERLFQKKYSRSAVENAISFLKEKNFIDDVKFARTWVETRPDTDPKGRFLLMKELKKKGVEASIVEEVLSGRDVDESALVKNLVGKKLMSFRGIPKVKAKRRVFGFLARRGFSYDVIEEALREHLG